MSTQQRFSCSRTSWTARLAAISLTKNIEMKDKPNGPPLDIVETIVAPWVEIDQIIGDWWSSLRSDGEDPRRVETHPLWISINEFCAHLTTAEVCDCSHGATLLCDDLLDNSNLRKEPILFALALSAAAQHMIHAASNVYTLCELARTSWNLTYQWDEWKPMFKAAETVESVEAKNDALAAAVAMDTAERLYKHRPVERERGMTTRASQN